MSSDHTAHDDAKADGAHDPHAFTGEPVQTLAPDEPRTPGWVPLLGIALFMAGTVAFLARHADVIDSGAAKPAESAVPSGNPVGVPQTPPPHAVPAAPSRPPGAATGEPRKLTPEQVDRVRKMMDAKKGGAAP